MAKNPKTPGLTIYLQPEVSGDWDTAKGVLSALEYTLLKDITSVTEIYYDPDIANTIVEADKDFVETYYSLSSEDFDLARLSPWCLRIELDKALVKEKNIKMDEFVTKILAEYGGEEEEATRPSEARPL